MPKTSERRHAARPEVCHARPGRRLPAAGRPSSSGRIANCLGGRTGAPMLPALLPTHPQMPAAGDGSSALDGPAPEPDGRSGSGQGVGPAAGRMLARTPWLALAPFGLDDGEAAATVFQATFSPAMIAVAFGCLCVSTLGALGSSSLAIYSPTKLQRKEPGEAGKALVDELDRRGREFRVVARFYLLGGLVGALLALQTGVEAASEAWALGGMIVAALLLCGSLPSALADARAESTLLRILPVLRGGLLVLRWPLVLPVLGLTQLSLRLLRVRAETTTDPEEIAEEVMAAVADSVDDDALADDEKAWIGNIVGLKDLQVSTIMTPRPDLVAIQADQPVASAVQFALEHGFSRYPVYREKVDEITGLFVVKDALRLLQTSDGKEQTVENLVRPPLFVPESMPVPQLLRRMQEEKIHLAVVLDEYGTTAGLVSVEDVLEQIVGEIEDEYDDEDELGDGDQVHVVEQGHVVEVPGRLPVDEVNQLLDLELPEDGDWETVAGYVIHHANRIPARDEALVIEGIEFKVLVGDDRRIERLRVSVPHDQPARRPA